MTGLPTIDPSNAIRIRATELDSPVYRIMSMRYLDSMLTKPELVLIHPHLWDDPWENILLKCAISSTSNPRRPQEFFERVLRAIYAQSWSRTQESDTLWRAYSWFEKDKTTTLNKWPDNEGVRIRSTPRKLLEALWSWSPTDRGESCFIGAVDYRTADEIQQYIADEIGRHGLNAFAGGRGHADAVLLKRSAFSYESEVRLIYVEPPTVGDSGDLLEVRIDLPNVIDEISFDPRLVAHERRLREKRARDLGYCGAFGESDLYQGVLFDIPLW
jgi:hypothetical protein